MTRESEHVIRSVALQSGALLAVICIVWTLFGPATPAGDQEGPQETRATVLPQPNTSETEELEALGMCTWCGERRLDCYWHTKEWPEEIR